MSKKNQIFKLHFPFSPAGDQPKAIEKLLEQRPAKSVLLGVTGSGKTFTLANVIAKQNNPVLILSPNKTLAAQLYEEFSLFFPENKVCYFVSYYDYYQPESYLPSEDIYIPKEAKINKEVERLRVEATAALASRKDTIVISSVSAIYPLGCPDDYLNLAFTIKTAENLKKNDFLDLLVSLQYVMNENLLDYGSFQVIGNFIIVNLPYVREHLMVEIVGGRVKSIFLVDPKNFEKVEKLLQFKLFPARHFVTTENKKRLAVQNIKQDLYRELPLQRDALCRQRLLTRITNDIEMLEESGYCTGIENYSRYFDGREEGEPPFCLLDFFPDEFLLVIDESHITIPQLRAMYKGDKARKKTLVNFGFRLTSAYDNRPLKFEEIESYFKDIIFVSATPGPYELKVSDHIVEQIVRPTGILDPKIEVVKRRGQLEHLIHNVKETAKKGYRSLITVLTQRGAEELADYFEEEGIPTCYLHSRIKTQQRTEILHKLRKGIFDCLIGINLLREGLDLPEVALVAILDADIEGFLRDPRSLIQTIGRAARNTESRVFFYADKITPAMKEAIRETERRRNLQIKFNENLGIQPQSVTREVVSSILKKRIKFDEEERETGKKSRRFVLDLDRLRIMEEEMKKAADNFDFEKAIRLRNEILKLEKMA